MSLLIDPTTEIGKAQMEALKFAEEQFNFALKKTLKGKFHLLRTVEVMFSIPQLGGNLQLHVGIEQPRNNIDQAIEEAKQNILEKKTIVHNAMSTGSEYGTNKI